jgi:hypothetical protein
MIHITSSPSRVYVAMCNKSSAAFGFYFRRFYLPVNDEDYPYEYTNNSETASWYFLNRLDGVACLENCFPVENMGEAGPFVPLHRYSLPADVSVSS